MFNALFAAVRRPSKDLTPAKPQASMLFNEFAIDTLFSALVNIPDPDVALQSAGITRAKLATIAYDDEIYAALETRRDAAISTPWRLEGEESEPLEWLWTHMESFINPALRGAWSASPYGYSVLESIWGETDAGRLGIRDISEKPLEWFKPQRDGSLRWVGSGTSINPQGELLDTNFKFFLTRRNPTYKNPYGEAFLSRLYWAWFFRHNAWRFWMQFLEQFGKPLLLGKTVDPNALIKALMNLGIDNAVAVGKEDDIHAVTQSHGGEFTRVNDAICARIQKTILGQTLTSQVGDTGSYAAAQVHNEVRNDKRMSDIRLITPTIQKIVNALWVMNAFPRDPPTFVLSDGAGLETERAKRDESLSKIGVRFTEEYFLRAYDLEEGEFTVGEPQPQSGGFAQFAAPGQGRFTARQQEVEDLVEMAMKDLPSSPVPTARILAAIKAATDPEDLSDRLAVLLAEVDTKEFEKVLTKALFAADVLGYAQEQTQKPVAKIELKKPEEESPSKETLLLDKMIESLESLEHPRESS